MSVARNDRLHIAPVPLNRPLTDDECRMWLPPKSKHMGFGQVLALIRQERPGEFARYFDGEVPPERDDRGRDIGRDESALLHLIVDYTGWDERRIPLIAYRSALRRPEWDQPAKDRITERVMTRFEYIALRALRAAAYEAAHGTDTAAPTELTLLTDAELDTTPDPAWLVEGLLLRDSLGVLFGRRNLGKSFLALDWALSVATGASWRGRSVVQGPVVYVAAEGWSGLKRRVHAWKAARGHDGLAGVAFLSGSVNLRREQATTALLNAIRAKMGDVQPVLVVVDTLNQAMAGGNENSPEDMGAVVASLQRLRRDTGATVLPLHHPRRADDEERGHSSLGDAADTMLRLTLGDDGKARVLACTKQRDGGWFEDVRFGLSSVADSLVVDDAEPAYAAGPGLPVDGVLRIALDALRDLCAGADTPVGVTSGKWEKAADLSARTFSRAKAALIDGGHVVRSGKAKSPYAHFRPADTPDTQLPF